VQDAVEEAGGSDRRGRRGESLQHLDAGPGRALPRGELRPGRHVTPSGAGCASRPAGRYGDLGTPGDLRHEETMAGEQHRQVVATVLLLTTVVLGLGACAGNDDPLARRRAEVAERGADVMPFDLDATTHTFTKTADGGRQTVVADDPADAEQIALIRAHLAVERDSFARGVFDDPAAIHGHDMDGVAELRAGYAAVSVEYADRRAGAELVYRTDDPDLVDAIHAWFDRQLMDHGPDAEAG
jgi:hypothetical protein